MSITVTGVNDKPDVDPVDAVVATYSDPVTPIVVTASDAETPANRLVFSATGLPGGLTIDSAGTIAGKPTGAPGSDEAPAAGLDEGPPARPGGGSSAAHGTERRVRCCEADWS